MPYGVGLKWFNKMLERGLKRLSCKRGGILNYYLS